MAHNPARPIPQITTSRAFKCPRAKAQTRSKSRTRSWHSVRLYVVKKSVNWSGVVPLEKLSIWTTPKPWFEKRAGEGAPALPSDTKTTTRDAALLGKLQLTLTPGLEADAQSTYFPSLPPLDAEHSGSFIGHSNCKLCFHAGNITFL